MFEKFTDEARQAVVAAQAEARQLKSDRIETPHLFLGIIAAAGPSLSELLADEGYTRESVLVELRGGEELGDGDARALETIGIDLDAVRASLDASFGEGALDRAEGGRQGWFRRRNGHVPFAAGPKDALRNSLREALARKDSAIGCEHLVLGLIRGADEKFTAVVREPQRLRERLGSRAA